MTDSNRNLRAILKDTAARRVAELQARLFNDDSTAVATLARLRRADPGDVGAEPLIWAVTLGDLPDVLTHFGDRRPENPTPAERALYAALVLYAVHQQSRDEAAHKAGISFGRAVGELARARAIGEELDAGTVSRLHQAALATDFDGRLHHLRGLIQLMRAERQGIGFDYGLLAVDLWGFADPYQDSNTVIARWGRDLHARPRSMKTNTEKETK